MGVESFDKPKLKESMASSLEALKREFAGLRTGRASSHLLDPLQVTVYGSKMPINQVASVSTPEPRTISVQVWDKTNVAAVEKSIRESNLGLNPVIDGTLIRLPIPALTADRRKELVKIAQKYAEQSKVSVRNVRREGMDQLKKLEKDNQISQDEHRVLSGEVQELTDKYIKDVEELLSTKETEIQTV
ncbi:MAG: ribosome recycling factor [Pseudomonadota bacterium]